MNCPNEEELLYTVEEWKLDDSRLLEVVARVHLLTVAFAAYEATVAARPRSRIVLRKQAHEMAAHTPPRSGLPAPR
jgi:hypothetical protein